ncbi:Uncharacterised protein [Klebsiella pneumoniae]|uniref:Uncharacterized protein n=1 Tax=Klebsiella pneumoniae TaxID=573 RepID=A0A378H494_KLEPN|nr:Uncharacterised protein [Klebsiella pneumoniae]
MTGTLSTTSGSFGETSLSGWLNMAKTLHNQRLMTENDTSRCVLPVPAPVWEGNHLRS